MADRALPARPVVLGWRLPPLWIGVPLFGLVLANLILVGETVWAVLFFWPAVDWVVLRDAAELAASGDNPYLSIQGDNAFRWSPIVAYVLISILPLGKIGWALLHVAALPLLRDRRLIALVLLSWPFWTDVQNGNLVVFVFIAAAAALSGSRVGTIAFLILSLLIPRPLMLPVLIWLLWRRAEWRVPFAVMVVAHAGLVLATGWGDEWLVRLLTTEADLSSTFNLAPSRWIGWLWPAIGLPLAAWLTWRGRLGLAAITVQPCLFAQYLLMGLLELVQVAGSSAAAASEGIAVKPPRPIKES